jgi:16S rRNA (guanine527-N7)-methyltransferase
LELLKKFIEEELNVKDERVYKDFVRYNELILEWNNSINVISRKNDSIENIALNSIFFLKDFKFPASCKMIDIGTGGGFPGIPIKILCPQIKLTLCDSIKKKIKVVKDICEKMALKDTDVLWNRAEVLSEEPEYRSKYDFVISKSVAPLHELYSWSRYLVKKDGEILCIKGGDVTGEITALKKEHKEAIIEVRNYTFDSDYKVEDKKLVIIKRGQ